MGRLTNSAWCTEEDQPGRSGATERRERLMHLFSDDSSSALGLGAS